MTIKYWDKKGEVILDMTPEEILQRHYKKRRFEQCEFLLKQRLAPIRGRCIELGSGGGYFSMMLSKLECVSEVIALDISKDSIEKCRPVYEKVLKPNLSKLKYVVGDMNKIEEGYGTFDTVIFSGSLHHSYDIPLSLKIANRLLRPKGVVVLHAEHYRPIFFSPRKETGHTPHTIIQFSKLLKGADFKPIVFRYLLTPKRFSCLKRILFTIPPFKFINGYFRFSEFVMLGIKL